MSLTVNLTEEEANALRVMYRQDLSKIQPTIDQLLAKKAFIESRLLELGTSTAIPKPTYEQLDLMGGVNLAMYNTLSKKIYHIFKSVSPENSTGETYNKLIEVFPEEANKTKLNIVQSISKELGKGGKDGKTYVKTANKDINGKIRYKLNKVIR